MWQIRKVFETVKWGKVCQVLSEICVLKYLKNPIKSICSDGISAVTNDEFVSENFRTETGVQHGSKLSHYYSISTLSKSCGLSCMTEAGADQ